VAPNHAARHDHWPTAALVKGDAATHVVSMYSCACMCMYVHVCACMCMYVHVCACMCMYVHVCACMYGRMDVHPYVRFMQMDVDKYTNRRMVELLSNIFIHYHKPVSQDGG
jgi:hypothetical protein